MSYLSMFFFPYFEATSNIIFFKFLFSNKIPKKGTWTYKNNKSLLRIWATCCICFFPKLFINLSYLIVYEKNKNKSNYGEI